MGQRIVPVTMGSPRFRSVELDGLRITEAEFAPNDVLPPHVHDRTVVAVMLQGSFDLAIRSRTHGCTRHTVFVEPGGERHANRIGWAGARVLVLEPTPLYQQVDLEPCAALLDAPAAFTHEAASAIARQLQVELGQRDAPRVPGEGQSTQGESGAKTRPTGVVDAQPVDIPVPPCPRPYQNLVAKGLSSDEPTHAEEASNAGTQEGR